MKLTLKNQYGHKDQVKSNKATQFIGLGTPNSSTHQYMIDWGTKANTGTYSESDTVFISINGKRPNRVGFDAIKSLVDKAISSNAKFITDNEYDRNREFNIGEREVATYLIQQGYTEVNGLWTKTIKETKGMKEFNPMQYIAIDISNCYGLDKLNYEDRIQWVKTNIDKLEDLQAQAEEPFLYYKAVRALRDGMAGLPINHHVALDSASSGLQLMSVMMRDKEGCYLTGLIDPNNRMDAYTLICDEMNKLMAEDGLEEVFVTRKQAKEAVMTGLYGSLAVPERVFGKVLLPYFYKALNNKASGAMNLLQLLKGSWNSVESSHTWTMPDGHYVQIPIMQMEDKRISIKEINYSPVARMAFNMPKKKGVSNIANVVHS